MENGARRTREMNLVTENHTQAFLAYIRPRGNVPLGPRSENGEEERERKKLKVTAKTKRKEKLYIYMKKEREEIRARSLQCYPV